MSRLEGNSTEHHLDGNLFQVHRLDGTRKRFKPTARL